MWSKFICKVQVFWKGHKIWNNHPHDLTCTYRLLVDFKSSGRSFQIFVVFSECQNFMKKNLIHATTIYVGKHLNVFGISSVNFEIWQFLADQLTLFSLGGGGVDYVHHIGRCDISAYEFFLLLKTKKTNLFLVKEFLTTGRSFFLQFCGWKKLLMKES